MHVQQFIPFIFTFGLSLFPSIYPASSIARENEYQQTAYKRHYPDISYKQLRRAIDAREVFIIDSNGSETYQKEHIPGAHTLSNKEELKKNLPTIKNYPIVVYCWSKKCTAWQKAADFAYSNGYTNIYHFSGGIQEWRNQGSALSSIND